jgi:hypothetical protein
VWLLASGVGLDLALFPAFSEASVAVAGRLKSAEALSNLEAWEGTQRLLHTNVQEALALEVGLLRLKL